MPAYTVRVKLTLQAFFSSLAVTTFFVCALASIPQMAQSHPTNYHRAAHNATLFLDDTSVTLQYTLQTPLPIGSHSGHQNNPLPESLANGWTIEADGSHIPWTITENESIDTKNQSIERNIRLFAPIPEGPKSLRISNGNLPDVRAFFCNTLWVSPIVNVTHTNLSLIGNANAKANLAGIWNYDQDSREIKVEVGPNNSLWYRFHIWSTNPAPWISPINPAHEASWYSVWFRGQKSATLTLIVLVWSTIIGLLWLAIPFASDERKGLDLTLLLGAALTGGSAILLGIPAWIQPYSPLLAVFCTFVACILVLRNPSVPSTGLWLLSAGSPALAYSPERFLGIVLFLLTLLYITAKLRTRSRKEPDTTPKGFLIFCLFYFLCCAFLYIARWY
jgi:hypothetical protein